MPKSVHSNQVLICTMKGLLLGVYEEEAGVKFTSAAEDFNKKTAGKLAELIKCAGPTLKKGKRRIFYNLEEYQCVSVVGLGKHGIKFNELEEKDEAKENIRTAVAGGATDLREVGATSIDIDPCGSAQAAAEGASLKLFSYDELKSEKSRKPTVAINCYKDFGRAEEWTKGLLLGDSQNFARRLAEAPANKMTPTIFAQSVIDKLQGIQNVEVHARDKQWATEKKMGSFLSVAQGSYEPPVFLEMTYNGGQQGAAPLVLVGKGITFDSGGISLKPSANMDKMRADMGGAAVVAGAMNAIAKLKLPINVIGLTPLSENMPGRNASRPGDVVTAMNGKTIQIDNTDAEGRLVLADALCYADTLKPVAIVDMATLTGAMRIALGGAAAGVFTNSTALWGILHKAGTETGDRVWRMPLWDFYSKHVTDCQLADVNNIGNHSPAGGACTAAAFLKEFVLCDQWMHMDIAGVMENKDEVPYLGKGMGGRPTRTIVEFVERFHKNQ
ncbi:PREDICTED: cytosol aminopeptidase-like isoform X2 [Priapulus caudatus]|uniref:Cytosol aminopeptidase n=1 Tax=Priapulus caudatus TaxID=37621 RepID=A0ABM1DNN0_PRICU|nr:PREDICTED: cytosol aminopeptidase-like isoform X2 [Priapulus caudatus]